MLTDRSHILSLNQRVSARPAVLAAPVPAGVIVRGRRGGHVTTATHRQAAMSELARQLGQEAESATRAEPAPDSEPDRSAIPAAPAVADHAEREANLLALELAAREHGYAEGYAAGSVDGRAAGLGVAEQQLEAALAGAATLAERLDELAPAQTGRFAVAVSELALSAARQIVGNAIHLEPALLISGIEAALEHTVGTAAARIFLRPEAVAAVSSAWEQRFGSNYLGRRWTFEADPSLPLGGCIVRYEHGVADVGVEVALGEMESALRSALAALLGLSFDDELHRAAG